MSKNKVEIDVKVDDKGTTKKLGVESKKAAKGLDDTAKGARTADRNLKGAAQASSNTTKNFSKMAQGTGGLVGAYATLAANIFAVTAAFSFLKTAADFRVIQASQLAFTGATGVGMKSLTANIQTASDSMLSFQAASEAASIGIASGLGAGQITELAEGASNVSKILGRDVTDSFNRLIRGVTKAEPELLDELGITLRLADAQENYASSLNKSAKDLSNFEKRQAVFAEVQGQLEQKYNNVADATDIQANAMSRLAVAFDKVLNPIKSFTSALAEPVAKFFSENIASFAVALGLLAVPLVKQIIPGLTDFAERAEESAQRASAAFKQTKADIADLQVARAAASRDPLAAGKAALTGIKTDPTSGAGIMQAGGTPSKRQLAAMKSSAKRGVGIVKQMTTQQKAAYIAAIDAMIAGNTKFGMSWQRTAEGIETRAKIAFKRMELMWQRTMSAMGKAATVMGKTVNAAMKLMGIVGVILMIKDLIEMLLRATGVFKANKAVEEYAERLDSVSEAMKSTNKEFEKFADIQTKMRQRFDKGGTMTHIVDRTRESIAAFGKMAGQVTPQLLEMNELLLNPVEFKKSSVKMKGPGSRLARKKAAEKGDTFLTELATRAPDTEEALEQFNKTLDTTIAGIKATGLASTTDGAAYLALLETAKREGKFTEDQAAAFEKLGKELQKTGGIAAFLKEQQKEITKQFTSQMNAITMFKTPQTQLIALLKDQLAQEKALADNEGKKERIANLERELELTKQLNRINTTYKNLQDQIKAIQTEANIGATGFQKEEIGRLSQLMTIETQRQQIIDKLNLAAAGKLTLDDAQKQAYANQLQLLNAQTAELERQAILGQQLRDSMMEAAEKATQTNIADLIKGKESSFKDAIKNIAESTLNAAADTLAKSITKKIFGKFTKTPAEKMQEAMEEGGNIAAQQIRAALTGESIASPDTILSKGISTEARDPRSMFEKAGDYFLGKKTQASVTIEGGKTNETVDAGSARIGGIFSDFSASLHDLFSGNAPFLSGIRNVFTDGLSGFGSLFGDIFGGLFGSGGLGLTSLFGFATGGIMDQGKKISGYSSGGIAKGSQRGYPAVLHGTEAVVPLPNGKSIPVEMQSAGSQVNNVVVNVNNDGSVRTEGSPGMDMEKLGNAVAVAVQKELQNQKRSGGILNPYGAA